MRKLDLVNKIKIGEDNMENTKNAWINVLFFILTLIVNALGAFGAINGLSQKEISDMYITLITPSPFAFNIWSIIYLLLAISLIMMIVKKDEYYRQAVKEISNLFRISCVFNIMWIIAFSYLQLLLSSVLILAFVIILSLICLKLLKINDGKHSLLPLSFGLYTGWLFIATVVNIAATLTKLNWNGFGISDDIWAIIVLMVSVVLVVMVMLKIKNAVFPLSIAWAYFGINKFLNSPEAFKGQYALLEVIALIGMGVLIFLSIFQFYRNSFSVIPKQKKVCEE